MSHSNWLNRCSLPLFAVLLSATCVTALADDATKAKSATTQVKLRDLVLDVPSTWTKEKPKSTLRLGQFRIPAVGDEKSDAELAVFSFGGSDVSANIKRWIAQYDSAERKTKITQGTSEQGQYILVELSGSYKMPIGPPIAGKTKSVAGSRTLAVILAVPEKGVYYLKLVGLDKTVAAQAKTFRTSFGADASKETEVTLDEKE